MRPRHLRLIATHWTAHSLRGGAGLIFVIASLFSTLWVASIVLKPVDLARDQMGEQVGGDEVIMRELGEMARPVVVWMLGGGSPLEAGEPGVEPTPEQQAAREWAEFLLVERPSALSAIYIIVAYLLPVLVVLGAFNQIAGDAGSRALRYLVPRVRRTEILLGRALGTVTFTVATIGLCLLLIATYVWLRIPVYEFGAIAGWTLRCWLMLSVLALPYVALCTMVSAMLGSAFGSMALASGILGGVPLIAWAGAQSFEAIGWLHYLLPFGYQHTLFHHEPLVVTAAVAGCLAHAAIFVGLAHLIFERRDL